MVDPFSWGTIGAVSSAASAAVSIGGTIAGTENSAKSAQLSGEAQQQMYMYQAGVAKANAKIARQNAAFTREAGESQAYEEGMKGRAQVGLTRAAQGASGLDVNTGSNRDVVQSEHYLSAANQTVIRQNAAQQAYGYEVQAAMEKEQVKQYRNAAYYAGAGADLNVEGSIIGGATSVASKWSQASQSGMFSGLSSSVPSPNILYGAKGTGWGIG